MPSVLRLPEVFWENVTKEMTAGRVLGPFLHPPNTHTQCSPMALVPKNGKTNSWRLVHNLSFPFNKSVNTHIPQENSTVHYKLFDTALKIVRTQGPHSWMAKSDLYSTFRRIPMHYDSLHYLGFKFHNLYMIYSVLPFGASSSCQIFEIVASFIDWLVAQRAGEDISHYLDDFFFYHAQFNQCFRILDTFRATCQEINFPISEEKTEGPTQQITFLGLTINTVDMTVNIPLNKIEEAISKIDSILLRKKVKVKQLQSITGLLNFCTKACKPGKGFLCYLYNAIAGLPGHFHISITRHIRQDLHMWLTFFRLKITSIPVPTFQPITAEQLQLFTDATAQPNLGWGPTSRHSGPRPGGPYLSWLPNHQ